MASRKHNRKGRRRRRPGKVSAAEQMDQARRRLASGDARGALDLLKRVPDGEHDPAGKACLHFCALTQRAGQLARRGQKREAAAMRARAAEQRSSIPAGALGEEDLVCYLGQLDAGDAVATYAAYLTAGSPFAEAERLLADRLVMRRCWASLDALDESHALRRDADHVKRGLDAMDAGEWERAADLLRGLHRRSPFAAWRVFCKAMACFGAGDDHGLLRAVDLLPENFALAGIVAELRRAGGGGGKGGPAMAQRALGTDGTTVSELGEALRQALRRNERTRVIERLMSRLAEALSPDDPLPALVDLVQIAGLATARSHLSMGAVERLAQHLLPARRVHGLVARIGLVLQQASLGPWNPGAATSLLGRLYEEFPRSGDHALVRGRVYEALARSGHRSVQPDFLPTPKVRELIVLLDGRSFEAETVFADLMEASLLADPGNRDGHRFLAELLRGRRQDRNRLRRVLEETAARFPEDAEPWLELTELHYAGNAYRRAEEALAEARRRAPHDDRIVGLQAVGFLKSSDQSRKSGRFELAARDLQRAEALGWPRLADVAPVKRLLLDLVSSGGDAAAVVAPRLSALPPAGQVKTLALLLHELEENSAVKNVTPEMTRAVRGLLALRAPMIGEIDTEEAAALLAPLPAAFRILYGRLHVAPVLADWWGAIMRGQQDEGLLDVFDILLDCGGRAAVRVEIGLRLSRMDKAERDSLLLLYLAVIRYQEGDDHDSRRFVEALEAAAPSERERLRAGTERLARVTAGILREALQTFDFGLLDPPDPLFGGDVPGPLSSLLDEMLGPEEEPPGEEPSLDAFLDALRVGLQAGLPGEPCQGSLFDDEARRELETLEGLIDRHWLRGVLSPLLIEVAEVARVEPEIRHNLDRSARKCEEAGLRDGLSREARIFLFPRKRGRRRA